VIDDDRTPTDVKKFSQDNPPICWSIYRSATISAKIEALVIAAIGTSVVRSASAIKGAKFKIVLQRLLERASP
jgi:hypothetical protein